MKPLATNNGQDEPYYSLATSFEIELVNGHPKGCHKNGKTLWTEGYGMGWRFGIRRDDDHSQDTDLCIGRLPELPAKCENVLVSILRGSKEGFLTFETEKTVDMSIGETIILSLCRSTFAAMPILCFVVTVLAPRAGEQVMIVESLSSLAIELGDSLIHGGFTDTRFDVFSRRRTEGGVEHLLPVFANSAVLKDKSEYFRKLLGDNGFLESSTIPLGGRLPETELDYLEQCDYESDSDLGDLAEDIDVVQPDAPLQTQQVPLLSSSFAHRLSSRIETSNFGNFVGRTVFVKDTAYITWKALIFYLYTGHVAFSPLKSDSGNPRRSYDMRYLTSHPGYPSPCSPKSLFRLADKLGLKDLEDFAFRQLKSSITTENIVDEYFSSFTSRYERVQDFELDFLRQHFADPTVKVNLQRRRAELLEKPFITHLLFSAFTKLMS